MQRASDSRGSYAQCAQARSHLGLDLPQGRVSRHDDTVAACAGRCQLDANGFIVHAQHRGHGRARGGEDVRYTDRLGLQLAASLYQSHLSPLELAAPTSRVQPAAQACAEPATERRTGAQCP